MSTYDEDENDEVISEPGYSTVGRESPTSGPFFPRQRRLTPPSRAPVDDDDDDEDDHDGNNINNNNNENEEGNSAVSPRFREEMRIRQSAGDGMRQLTPGRLQKQLQQQPPIPNVRTRPQKLSLISDEDAGDDPGETVKKTVIMYI